MDLNKNLTSKKQGKVVAIEIGYSTIKICEMTQGENPKIYHCIEVPTPVCAISDGYLHPGKVEAVKDAILTALQENKIRTKKVIFSLYSSKIITREILLPLVKPSQINAVIETNINEYFPIDLDEYAVTHALLKGGVAEKHRVLAIAAERILLEQYEELADACGLKLLDIDYTGNSIMQAVKNEVRISAEMVVKIEQESAFITIIKDNTIVLQRNVNYGIGKAVTTAGEMREAMEPLGGTILRMVDFYSGQAEGNVIESITIVGKGADYMEQFDEIEQESGIPIRKLKMFSKVRLQKNAALKKPYEFAGCIGAGISSVHFIKEKNDITEVDYTNTSILLIVFFIVAIAGLCTTALLPYKEQTERQEQLLALKERYAPAKAVYDEYVNVGNLHEQIRYGHELTRHTNDSLTAFLEELERKLPNDVEVTEFASNDNEVIITMRVDDKETAAGVIQRLREFDTLMSVVVNGITEERQSDADSAELTEKETTVIFSTTCTYYPMVADTPSVQMQMSDGAGEAQTADSGLLE